jgi:5-carboxymethyl-2-hydroxymuconate isomerase
LPHCIIDHSDNIKNSISWESIFRNLHKILVDTGEIKEADIKSRVNEYKNYFISDGNPNQAFVTLNIQLLDGRSDEFKEDLAQSALKLLSKYFEKTFKELKTSLTVQITDIHRKSYNRKINY